MKNNWNKTVTEINRKRYVIPEGWDTREVVAEQLQCAPDKVADLLKPGLSSGEIERQTFSVWDESRRMAIPTVCYRVASPKQPGKGPVEQIPGKPSGHIERVQRAILKYPGLSDYEVSRKLSRSSAAEVAAVRKEMGL
jgi:hypothetical protein